MSEYDNMIQEVSSRYEEKINKVQEKLEDEKVEVLSKIKTIFEIE